MGTKCSKGSNFEYGDLPKKKGGDDDVGELELKEVENGASINELIKEFNELVAQWNDNYAPVSDAKDAT